MRGPDGVDEAAILRLIETETAAYFRKDYEAWARCWVHAPHVRRFGWYARGGRLVHKGWEQEATVMKLSMERYPATNRSPTELRRENISIRLGQDMAWVTFEQIAPRTGDPIRSTFPAANMKGASWKRPTANGGSRAVLSWDRRLISSFPRCCASTSRRV